MPESDPYDVSLACGHQIRRSIQWGKAVEPSYFCSRHRTEETVLRYSRRDDLIKPKGGAARWQGLQPPIVIYDEMADFTTPWPGGKSIALDLDELIRAARKRGLTEMEAEADQGWPGQAGDDPESEG